jgi:tRNA(Ile)-lysidine synthase TilS/MesJ
MARIEPTLEDWEDYWNSLELDELYRREEALELLAEQEEAESARERVEMESYGLPAQESEFDRSEDDDCLPD